MSEKLELDITEFADEDTSGVINAIEAASSQDKITWLAENGKRVAAIVPVDVAEAWTDRRTSPKVQYPDVTVRLVGQDGSTGAIMGAVTSAMADAGYGKRDQDNVRAAIFGCESYEDVLKFVMHTVNVR